VAGGQRLDLTALGDFDPPDKKLLRLTLSWHLR